MDEHDTLIASTPVTHDPFRSDDTDVRKFNEFQMYVGRANLAGQEKDRRKAGNLWDASCFRMSGKALHYC